MELALTNINGLLFFVRWMHVFFGIIWIGHLYYFNFVHGGFMADVDAPTKSNAVQKLLPRALWWFRWGAVWTFLTGWTYLAIRGHLGGAEQFKSAWGMSILTGGLFGTFMFLNVWLIIWPNQKIVIANAQAVAAGKAANPDAPNAAARALLASRTNTLFSIPMLFCMEAARHLPLAASDTTKFGVFFGLVGAIMLVLEINAIKGKLGPLTTVKGVLTSGFVLTTGIYALMEILK
jgi:uncharacterized membrane protein